MALLLLLCCCNAVKLQLYSAVACIGGNNLWFRCHLNGGC